MTSTAEPTCDADICIVGGGAAGIILALELSRLRPDARLLLIEYGERDSFTYGNNPLDDSIEIDNLLNHHTPDECTNKGLGGATNTWGGRCVMYDPVDFIPRRVVQDNCTWDLSFYNDCARYVSQAQDYFLCSGPFTYPSTQTPIAENFASSRVSDDCLELWSLPTRFGAEYREQLESLPNLTIRYETEVLRIHEGAEGDATIEVRRWKTGDRVESLKTKAVVLCAGAFETTRLLLRSPDLFGPSGDSPPALGKYYQGHVSGKIASIVFNGDPKKTDFGFGRREDGCYVRRRFQLTTETLVDEDLLSTAMWLDNPLYYDPSHRSGSMSLMYLAMLMPWVGSKLAPPAIRHSVTKGKLHALHRHLWNIVRDVPHSLVTPLTIFYKRYLCRRKLPGVFLYSKSNEYALHFHAEQTPFEENRLELSECGRRLLVHYQLTDDDIRSVIRNHAILDEELRQCGAGYLRYWFPPEDLESEIRKMSRDGVHQCGTTRIADTPDKGVVDRDLKVFGAKGAYVCSSSCFPTSSQANPTFMIGVLAVRLANHLAETVHAPSRPS